MKTKFIALSMLIASLPCLAQNSRFVLAMKKNLTMIDTSKSIESLQSVSNNFERIANAEKKEWLPCYYASYLHVLMGMNEPEKSKKDDYYDRAKVIIDKADSLSPENSEIYTLQAFILQMKLNVNPMIRGAKYGPEAGKYLEKAKQLNPDNPRAYYLQGQSTFYTPAMFGGGKDKACPILQEAVEKFRKFKPSGPIMPNWGEEQAIETYKACQN